MKRQVTFGHILTILSIIIIPLMVWGVNVERRFEQVISNTEDIKKLENNSGDLMSLILENHKETMEGIHSLELQLKDKKDRE